MLYPPRCLRWVRLLRNIAWTGALALLMTASWMSTSAEILAQTPSPARSLVAPPTADSPVEQPAARPAPPPGDTGWLDTDFGLQFRLRLEESLGEPIEPLVVLPLVHLEIRNTGSREFRANWQQGSHQLIVDGEEYRREGQTGEAASNLVGHAPRSSSFLLTPDWIKTVADKPVHLTLAPGPHTVAIHFSMLENFQDDSPEARQARGGNDWREIITAPLVFEVALPPADGDATSLALENIRRELAVFPHDHAAAASPNLQRLVRDNQPASGDFLLTLVGPGNDTTPDPAGVTIAATWDSFTPAQLERYFAAAMVHSIPMRPSYPAGVDVSIGATILFAPGYKGLPREEPKVASKTTTTRYVDGQQDGSPFVYNSHSAAIGSFKIGGWALGRHTIRVVTDYEFRRGDQVTTGRVESRRRVEIVPDAGDDLIAPQDEELEKQVRESLVIEEVSQKSTALNGGGAIGVIGGATDDWSPQMRWSNRATGEGGSLHTPLYSLVNALPVDLCFDVQFRIEGTNDLVPGSPIHVPAGQTSSGNYFSPSFSQMGGMNGGFAILRKHADADGFVAARVELTPSRKLALSDPLVMRYYGGTITSEVVRLRVDHNESNPVNPFGGLGGLQGGLGEIQGGGLF